MSAAKTILAARDYLAFDPNAPKPTREDYAALHRECSAMRDERDMAYKSRDAAQIACRTARRERDEAVALLRRAVAVPMISGDANLYGDIEECLSRLSAADKGVR